MKYIKFNVALTVAFLIMCSPLSFSAAETIKPQKECSLTLEYKNEGKCIEGLEVKTYRVAEITSAGGLELCGKFADYPVVINGIKNNSEWKQVITTLSGYISGDKITTDYITETDINGAAVFEKLLPGMYLTLSVNRTEKEKIIVFESFLTLLPSLNEDETYSYNVKATPKSEIIIPESAKKEFKVIKLWRDGGNKNNRPDAVTVDILKNGELLYTEVLSSENNWCFAWKALDDGSVYEAVERDIPMGYTVSVSKSGRTFTVTNTADSSGDTPPDTGDTTVIMPYILAMCISGIMLVILSMWRKRSIE